MIKATFFLVRRPDLSHEAFLSYWMGDHLALSRSLPEAKALVRRYVQQHPIIPAPEGFPQLDYDGCAEVWFDTIDDLVAAFTSENFTEVIGTDEANFLDRSKTRMLISEERDDLWPSLKR